MPIKTTSSVEVMWRSERTSRREPIKVMQWTTINSDVRRMTFSSFIIRRLMIDDTAIAKLITCYVQYSGLWGTKTIYRNKALARRGISLIRTGAFPYRMYVMHDGGFLIWTSGDNINNILRTKKHRTEVHRATKKSILLSQFFLL